MKTFTLFRRETGCQNNGRQHDVVARCLWLQQFEQQQLHTGVEITSDEKVIASAIEDLPIFWELASGMKLTTLTADPGARTSDRHPCPDPDLRILKVSVSDTMDTVLCCVANGCATVWRRKPRC